MLGEGLGWRGGGGGGGGGENNGRRKAKEKMDRGDEARVSPLRFPGREGGAEGGGRGVGVGGGGWGWGGLISLTHF